ncbi:MAG: hypothetical protein ACOCQ7_01990 [Natronomonas sp.]
MSKTTIETTRRLLDSALEDVDNPDVSFKIRSALQLLVLIEERTDEAKKTLEEADIDEKTRESLHELGYLD